MRLGELNSVILGLMADKRSPHFMRYVRKAKEMGFDRFIVEVARGNSGCNAEVQGFASDHASTLTGKREKP